MEGTDPRAIWRCGESDTRLPVDGLGLGAPPLPSGPSTGQTALPSPIAPGSPLSPRAGRYSGSWQGGTPEGLGLQPSLASGSSLPCPPGPVMQAASRRLAAPLWTLGRPLQGRREAWAWLPPGPHPTAAGNTCGGGRPASRPAAALGKDSWSQPGRLAGPTVRQASGNRTLGRFPHCSPAGPGLWIRLPLLTHPAVGRGCPGPRPAGRRPPSGLLVQLSLRTRG